MLVQCPNCKTTYKVSDDVVKDSSPAFRCSRCKHTFELNSAETTQPTAGQGSVEERHTPLATKADDINVREPKFAFPPRVDTEHLPQQPELPDIDVKPNDAVALHDRDEPWSINSGPAQQEEPFTITDNEPAPREPSPSVQSDRTAALVQEAATPLQEPQDFMDNVLSIEPYREQQASTVPFLTLFGLLVALFSFAAAYYQAHPIASEGIVGKIPLVGSSVLQNNHLKDGVLLKSLQGSYQAIQGSREVFIVSGTAVNQNPVVIRKVRLAGQIFNNEGKEVEQQSMWIGNALSPKIVRGMTVQDIADLQKLEPLRNFEIPPGDSVPFTLVFIKPNKAAKDFACEVTTAEGGA
jgi:predicted Zn finger-like uncharacterized protein